MMDSVEIRTSDLNCVNSVANSVQDANHETNHDLESQCSAGEQSKYISDKMVFSKSEPHVFDKPLYGTALESGVLTGINLEDYSDVSSCSEAEFSHILDKDKNTVQSSKSGDAGSSNKKEMEKVFCPDRRRNACSANVSEKQDYVSRCLGTETEKQSGSSNMRGKEHEEVEKSLEDLEDHCSNLCKTENGCSLKTEQQMKEGFYVHNTDCDVSERSKNCKDCSADPLSSICALDLNCTKQNIDVIEKNASIPGNVGIQIDCHFKGVNSNCKIKNVPEVNELKHDVINTVHDYQPDYDGAKGQVVEHSSFEFLQSCLGLSSVDHTKLDRNAANLPLFDRMTVNSANSESNFVKHSVLVSPTLEAAGDGPPEVPINSSTSVSQETGQQNASSRDAMIKNGAFLLSSEMLSRKLHPVVLVKTTNYDSKAGSMYFCSVCQMSTENLDELIEHHHFKHSKHAFQYCLNCGIYFSNKTLSDQHFCKQFGPKDIQQSDAVLSPTKRLRNAKYLCMYCHKPFIKKSYYADHELRHTTVTQHRCNCCGLYFPNAKKLDVHKRKVKCTPMILDPCDTGRKYLKADYKNTVRQPFAVDDFQTGFHNCFVKLVDINKKQPSSQQIKCPVCGRRFILRAQLKVHLKSHETKKSFKCNKCNEVFKYSWNLNKHKEVCSGSITKHHVIEQHVTSGSFYRFSCPTCPRVFVHSYNRVRHMRERCLKEYMQMRQGKVGDRYKCPLCKESFTKACNRNRHIKNTCFQQYKLKRKVDKKKLVKVNVKDEEEDVLAAQDLSCYKCKLCPATFAYKSGVSRHMKKHSLLQRSTVPVGKHDIPMPVKRSDANYEISPSQESLGQKSSETVSNNPLLCVFCDKCFDSSDSLKNHMQLHGEKKPFRCLVCGKNFGKRGHLITHKNVHKRRIQCSLCKKIVPTIEDLLDHQQSHIKKGMFQCPDCPRQFKFPLFFLKHVATHSVKEAIPKSSLPSETPSKKSGGEALNEFRESFFCKVCQMSFVDSKAMSEHCLIHLPEPYVHRCTVCKRNFSCRISVVRHIRLHTGEKPFPCKTCGIHFHRKERLRFHEINCKGLQKKALSQLIMAQTSTSDTVVKRLSCSYCPHIFKRTGNLKLHEKAHLANNLLPCLNCGKYYKKNKITGHRKRCNTTESTSELTRREKPEAYKSDFKGAKLMFLNRTCRKAKKNGTNGKDRVVQRCPHCSKHFPYRSYLLRHMRSHSGNNHFACKHCGQKYGIQQSCQHHEASCEAKQLNESKEPKVAPATAVNLKESTVNMGGNAEQLKCNFCTKTFTKTRYLRRHILTHTDVKPYRCKSCENCFSRHDHLKYHQTRCKGKKKQLDMHLEQYTSKWKYQCKYCPRSFDNHSNLKSHTRRHTGEKPFKCASCDERFIRKDYLKRHLLKCSGEREGPKVLCDRCGGLFTQETLQMHQNNCRISLQSTESNVGLRSSVLTTHQSDGLQQSAVHEHEQLSSKLLEGEPADGRYSENLHRSHKKYANNGQEYTAERKKPFKCEQCNMRFLSKGGLGMHMRMHKSVYPHSCQKCSKGFWSQNEQQRHIKKCKGLEVTKTEQNIHDAGSSELECTNKVLVFNKGSNATGTGVLQTKFSCKDQDKVNSDKGDAVVHKYQCSECEQSFTDGLMLISHLEAHGREDQDRKFGKCHECHVCNKNFEQGSMLQRHIKSQHQEMLKNTCPECFQSFRHPSDLDIHRSYHDLNRPFVCDTCALRFWTIKSLNAHQKQIHSVSEPVKTTESPKVFTCHPCNKIYTVKGSYMKHCRVKHKGCSKSVDEIQNSPTEHDLSSSESDVDISDADDKEVNDDSDSAPYFPCHVCGKTFLTSESLEDHQRCHLGEKPYECEECGKCFIQLVNLQQHQRSHKSEFQCQMCGKGFVSVFALRKHKTTHLRKHPHRCTKCHLSFTRSSQLREHMITHRDENFPCDLCHEIFSCKSSRAEHRKIHTEEELPPLIPPAKQSSSPPVSVGPLFSTVQQYRYCCEICNVRFPDHEQLLEHGCSPTVERPYSCKDCDKHFLQGSHLKKHQLTHQLSGTQNFQCNSCHMSFTHRHHFLRHLQKHGGEESSKSQIDDKVNISNADHSNQDKIYRCPICPERFSQVLELANHLSVHANMCNVCKKTFSTKQELEKHEQCHLSAATQYECTECGKSFVGSDSFRQHYCVHRKQFSCSSLSLTDKKRCSSEVPRKNEEEEDVDVGEDFYNCPTCNKRFSSSTILQEHQKLHEFDRPFKCLVCGRAFPKQKYLKQHQVIHKNQQYQCDMCSSFFKTKQALLTHHKSHEVQYKYHCSVCDKSCKTPYDLSRHERIHSQLQSFGEKSGEHRCDMCYKSFNMLSQLRQHQESHVGQIVYECTECDKAFAFLHLLEQHQQTHGISTVPFQSQSSSFQSPGIE